MTVEGVPVEQSYPVHPGSGAETDARPGPAWASDNTPGVVGSLLAVVLSWMLISVGSLTFGFLLEDGLPELGRITLVDLGIGISFLAMWSVFVGFFGALTAPFGVAAVHFACLRTPHQWVHVAAAGLVGGVAVYGVAVIFGEPWRDWDKMAAGVGLCTAIGRAAVIPLVPAVRHRQLARRFGWPVDGDFRTGRTAC